MVDEEHSDRSSMEDDMHHADRLLLDVAKALRAGGNKEVFAIGGNFEIDETRPIVIRWDRSKRHTDTGRKCTLPIGKDKARLAAFTKLLDDCSPATFGRGKKDVLDEEYRKAGAMDESVFSTNFNLASYDLMDTVCQALVQSEWHAGVTAELYKLNVYSGPNGKFKSHVDTPRSKDQIGSLVICLPCEHEGGALVVRHGGRQVLFDWAASSSSTIQWAALFSDCEHEVLQVKSGHRITLTYNLFLSSGGPYGMATQLRALDQEKLHFYAKLKTLIECPSFLPDGGAMGFACQHLYPHTSESHVYRFKRLDCAMKGMDMLVFQAFSRFSNNVHCEAVIEASNPDDEHYDSDEEEQESILGGESNALARLSVVSAGQPGVLEVGEVEYGWPDPDDLRSFERKMVTWLNGEPTDRSEFAVAWIAHGNQPEINYHYSAAAIIATIQPYEARISTLVAREDA